MDLNFSILLTSVDLKFLAKTLSGFDSGMRGDDKEAWVISAAPTTAERVRRLRFDRFAYQYYACLPAIDCLFVRLGSMHMRWWLPALMRHRLFAQLL